MNAPREKKTTTTSSTISQLYRVSVNDTGALDSVDSRVASVAPSYVARPQRCDELRHIALRSTELPIDVMTGYYYIYVLLQARSVTR